MCLILIFVTYIVDKNVTVVLLLTSHLQVMKRKLKLLEYRRLQGARLLMKGVPKAEVARQLGVSRQSVQNWAIRLTVKRETGFGGNIANSFQAEQDEFLRNKKRYKTSYQDLRCKPLGRPRMIAKADLHWLKKVLKAGAKNSGYSTDKWTLSRIQDLIQKACLAEGETISRTQVMRTIEELGFGCAKPSSENQALLRKWERLGWIEV